MKKKQAATRSRNQSSLAITVLLKFRMIVNTAKRHYRWIEQECGVNGVQLWALWEISRSRDMRVSDLTVALAVHQSSASNLLDKLVKSGLVVRTRSAEDKRVVTLALTKKGAALLKRAPRPARGILPEALHRLSAARLAQLDDSLMALLKCMKTTDKSGIATPLAIMLGER
jgi:MarR family transcriptional regulator, organic hydroperoxide resistance regulator